MFAQPQFIFESLRLSPTLKLSRFTTGYNAGHPRELNFNWLNASLAKASSSPEAVGAGDFLRGDVTIVV